MGVKWCRGLLIAGIGMPRCGFANIYVYRAGCLAWVASSVLLVLCDSPYVLQVILAVGV
jgi:hypothetical protein